MWFLFKSFEVPRLKNDALSYFILHFAAVKEDGVMDVPAQIAFFHEKPNVNPGHNEDAATGCHLYSGSVRSDGYCHIIYINE